VSESFHGKRGNPGLMMTDCGCLNVGQAHVASQTLNTMAIMKHYKVCPHPRQSLCFERRCNRKREVGEKEGKSDCTPFRSKKKVFSAHGSHPAVASVSSTAAQIIGSAHSGCSGRLRPHHGSARLAQDSH
jgi:hypothetical protein